MLSRKIPFALLILWPCLVILTPAFPDPLKDQRSNDSLVITAVGDIMMGSHYPTPDLLPRDDGESLFKEILHNFSDSDLVFGNLEGCFLDEGDCVKKCKNPESCYAFKMPEHYVRHLVKAGFTIMSIANNHIGDFGNNGIQGTVRSLSKTGIHFAGVHSHPNTMFEQNGMKIGFCAFSPNQAAPDPRDMENARRIVERLNRLCDIVVVSVHAGAEGDKNRHVTRKTEIYHDEDRGNVYAFAHNMVDAGADVILGHGPHVTRAMELYKGRLIAYSLGNFCTYGRFNLKGHNGTAPILRLKTNKNGEFIKGFITPVYQTPGKGPSVDPQNRAIDDIIRLTEEDFPETPLSIDASGMMSVKGR